MLIESLSLNAKERVIHSYLYHDFKVYDRENNITEDIPSAIGKPIGLFIIAEIDGENFLSITLGKDILYKFKIVLSKNIDGEDGTRAVVYAGGMIVKGQTVPLQVFVCYSKSSIPDSIMVDVFDSPTLIVLNKLVPKAFTGSK